MKAKIALASLGCAKNQVDSEVMLGLLTDAGYELTNQADEAAVLIVNTCGFITAAKEESIAQILEFAALKDEGSARAVVVTGCLSQRYPQELKEELPEVDAFLGVNQVGQIVEIVDKLLAGEDAVCEEEELYLYSGQEPRILTTPVGTALVKLAEGCNNCCTYCAIPAIRGPYRSRPLEAIVAEAKELATKGAKELILVAQDTSYWGTDIYGKPSLDLLLGELAKIEELVWLRPLYFYPTRITDGLLATIAQEPKVCSYLDLPLQHASGKVLSLMGRGGNRAGLLKTIARIREQVPGAVLRSTFIVGFPGEEDADFQELLAFLAEAKMERVGVFTYSREEGTVAADLAAQVPEEVALSRAERLMELQREISRTFNESRIGQEYLVLSEGEGPDGGSIVRSQLEAPEVDGIIYLPQKLEAGAFAKVRIVEADDYDLQAELIEKH